MSDANQAATETIDAARYKDLQAEFTRKSQELADLKKAFDEGRFVDRTQHDREWQEHLATRARQDRDALLAELGITNDGSGRSAAGLNGNDGMISATYPGFDDSILVDGSDAQQRFVSMYGLDGLETAKLTHLAPRILRATGLDQRVAELQQSLEETRRHNDELRELANKSREYADAAYFEARKVGDPLLKKVQEASEIARKDPRAFWDSHLKMQEELEAFKQQKAAQAAPAASPAPPNGNGQQPTSAADHAAVLREANSVPASAGAASGEPDSRPADPLEAAFQTALAKYGAR